MVEAFVAPNPRPVHPRTSALPKLKSKFFTDDFLKLDGRPVETRPIKGTIARSADSKQDQRRAEILVASEKDRAENIMIVDLLRNDLARVRIPRSVEIPVLCDLESYASVHHLILIVTGRLQ